MKSGKVTMGYKSTLKTLRQGKCAALLLRQAAVALLFVHCCGKAVSTLALALLFAALP